MVKHFSGVINIIILSPRTLYIPGDFRDIRDFYPKPGGQYHVRYDTFIPEAVRVSDTFLGRNIFWTVPFSGRRPLFSTAVFRGRSQCSSINDKCSARPKIEASRGTKFRVQ